jgi:hypothetical protein
MSPFKFIPRTGKRFFMGSSTGDGRDLSHSATAMRDVLSRTWYTSSEPVRKDFQVRAQVHRRWDRVRSGRVPTLPYPHAVRDRSTSRSEPCQGKSEL